MLPRILRWAMPLGLAPAACVAAAVGPTVAQQPAAAWTEVMAKGKAEGRVNLYSVVVPQQTEKLIAAFNKKYPEIKVSHTRGAGEMPARVEAERKGGVDGADVFIWSDPLWYNRNEDHLLPLNTPAGLAFPAEKGWQVKGKAANVGFPPFGLLVWNTKFIKNGLKDHRDLLRPELQGRIGTREDVTAVVAGYLDFLQREFGEDYLKALARQKPKFYPTLVPAVQAVAAGEVWAINIGAPFAVKDLQDQGAPIAWVTPTPKGFANSWVGAALSASKRPHAALVFMDYMLSAEGQAILNGEQASGSAIPGLAGTLDMSNYEILVPEKFTTEVRDGWRKKFDEIFR